MVRTNKETLSNLVKLLAENDAAYLSTLWLISIQNVDSLSLYNASRTPCLKQVLFTFKKSFLVKNKNGIHISHGIRDVGGEHEIGLGIWHHGRVATHGDFQKNHIRKYFPAIFRRKWTKSEIKYCNKVAKWVKCATFIV